MSNLRILWAGLLLATVAVFVAVLALAGLPVRAGSPSARAKPPPARPPSRYVLPGTLDQPGAPLRAGGPDAFGYIFSDSNEPNGPGYDYVAASQVISGFVGDDVSRAITLPFAVSLYGNSSPNLVVNTNGLLTFNATNCGTSDPCYQNSAELPSTTAPPDMIAPFWDDLIISATLNTGIYTDVRGTAPARSFVIEWRNATFFNDPTASVTFQAVLHENSNQIDFEYATLAGTFGNGSSATIGLQNRAQNVALPYSVNTSALTSGTAVRFLAVLSPGAQQANSACATVVYTGTVINPTTAALSFTLSTSDSNAAYSSTVAPTTTDLIAPGASVPFTVTVTVPSGTAAGQLDTTLLTATSVGLPRPLTEGVRLTTAPGAEFSPATRTATGNAGSTLIYTTTLYNRTLTTTHFILSSGGNTWTANVSPYDSGPLAPNAGVPVTVSLSIPAEAQPGSSDTVTITATGTLSGCQVFATAAFTGLYGNTVTRARMPLARARHAQADFPANGRVYLLGGIGSAGTADLPIAEYDPRADSWTTRNSLIRGVFNVGAATLGDKIYVPGGFDGNTAVTLLQTYQPATDAVAVVSSDPLPAPRYGAGVTALNGILYVIGGSDNITATQTVFAYNPTAAAGARWVQRANMPTPRVALSAVALDGRIYALGGLTSYNHPIDLKTVEVYDPTTNTWTVAPQLLTARGGLAAIGVDSSQPCGGAIYALGGGWYAPLATTERYDIATGTWTLSTPLQGARRSLAAGFATNGNLLLITGGFSDLGTISNLVDALNCGGSLPPPTPTPVGGLPTPTPIPCAGRFSDVGASDYFYRAVSDLACRGAIGGYSDGTFRPYNQMSRAQLSKVVVLGEGWTIDTSGGSHFVDVPPDSTFYPYIETALHHAIISGYSDGTFRPSNPVSRAQIAKIVVSAAGWSLVNPTTGHFSDVPPASTFYQFVETAVDHGILNGYSDGTFLPSNAALRGQVSKIVDLALVQQ